VEIQIPRLKIVDLQKTMFLYEGEGLVLAVLVDSPLMREYNSGI
jgi:hypothetical protein